jgi:hypothetical protein
MERGRIHWVAWDKLLAPKCKGGMGFWDMKKIIKRY